MGNIMNRFSQDMQLIDFEVTLRSMSAAEGISSPETIISITHISALSTTIARIIVVCATAKYVATIIPPTLFIVYLIQKAYLRTSRQLRYLDIEAKAPLYTLFMETLDGLPTIRAFNWTRDFRHRSYLLIDGAQKPFHLLNCIQRWLAFVLDMLLAGVSVLVVIFAVKLKGQATGAGTRVALVNVLACHQHLAGFVQRWTMLDASIGAVSRVRAFERECPVEIRHDGMPLPAGWPEKGGIEIRNVSAWYKFVILFSTLFVLQLGNWMADKIRRYCGISRFPSPMDRTSGYVVGPEGK
jgi:ATP-binding cassette subfamily C (CFTR/MRP) protein 1